MECFSKWYSNFHLPLILLVVVQVTWSLYILIILKHLLNCHNNWFVVFKLDNDLHSLMKFSVVPLHPTYDMSHHLLQCSHPLSILCPQSFTAVSIIKSVVQWYTFGLVAKKLVFHTKVSYLQFLTVVVYWMQILSSGDAGTIAWVSATRVQDWIEFLASVLSSNWVPATVVF